jgi:hypothetical protein
MNAGPLIRLALLVLIGRQRAELLVRLLACCSSDEHGNVLEIADIIAERGAETVLEDLRLVRQIDVLLNRDRI